MIEHEYHCEYRQPTKWQRIISKTNIMYASFFILALMLFVFIGTFGKAGNDQLNSLKRENRQLRDCNDRLTLHLFEAQTEAAGWHKEADDRMTLVDWASTFVAAKDKKRALK